MKCWRDLGAILAGWEVLEKKAFLDPLPCANRDVILKIKVKDTLNVRHVQIRPLWLKPLSRSMIGTVYCL
jgi:hypothetical protein